MSVAFVGPTYLIGQTGCPGVQRAKQFCDSNPSYEGFGYGVDANGEPFCATYSEGPYGLGMQSPFVHDCPFRYYDRNSSV